MGSAINPPSPSLSSSSDQQEPLRHQSGLRLLDHTFDSSPSLSSSQSLPVDDPQLPPAPDSSPVTTSISMSPSPLALPPATSSGADLPQIHSASLFSSSSQISSSSSIALSTSQNDSARELTPESVEMQSVINPHPHSNNNINELATLSLAHVGLGLGPPPPLSSVGRGLDGRPIVLGANESGLASHFSTLGETAAAGLVQAAYDAGSTDNLSVVLVVISFTDPAAAPSPRDLRNSPPPPVIAGPSL